MIGAKSGITATPEVQNFRCAHLQDRAGFRLKRRIKRQGRGVNADLGYYRAVLQTCTFAGMHT
jgi:hypothetical protein